ncbi:hypothetical protein [Parasitella parasitica]|uniref:Uncharacterized protein n=1 Tax=Parasitella parasitica TaxID=35722 RepID=A0A0B7NW84_9FUNG|nr:hypothetical protein [Parasitella parasitica]
MKGSSRTNFNYVTIPIPSWVNNPTLTEFCFSMIGRADIEESKSNVAMNAWLPQASYPCGHTFMVCIHTENQNQGDFCPFTLREISVLAESPLGHLRYCLTDVPPQPNSPLDNVNNVGRPGKCPDLILESWPCGQIPYHYLKSSSTGSSFPADSAKPVPLAVVSLDNSQIPLVRTSSKLIIERRPPEHGTRSGPHKAQQLPAEPHRFPTFIPAPHLLPNP